MLPDIINYIPDPKNGRPISDGKVYFLTGSYNPPKNDSDIDVAFLADVTYLSRQGNIIDVPQPIFTSQGGTLLIGSQANLPDVSVSSDVRTVAVYDKCGKLVYAVSYNSAGNLVAYGVSFIFYTDITTIPTDKLNAGSTAIDLDSGSEYIWAFYLGTDDGFWSPVNQSWGAPSHQNLPGRNVAGAHEAESITNSIGGTAQDSLRILTPETFNAVGDLTANDTSAISSLMANAEPVVVATADKKYLVTEYANSAGKDIYGAGSITIEIGAEVYQKLNSYADISQHISGVENLFPFHNLLISQSISPTRSPKIVFTGDSTTTNDYITNPAFNLNTLLAQSANFKGLQTPFGLNVIQRGQSGKTAKEWINEFLGGDLSENPDLLIIRWGINHGTDNAGNPLSEGLPQFDPIRQTPENWLSDMRGALEFIRESRTLTQMSVILMTPNSTSDSPNARDEFWYEAIGKGIRQIARDYSCCFIDTYAIMKDSRKAAGIWMDDPYADGRAIHPLEAMNAMIVEKISSVAFPEALKAPIGVSGIRNQNGNQVVLTPDLTPNFYTYGVNIQRAGEGFPYQGFIETVISRDNMAIQYNYDYLSRNTRFAVRTGRSAIVGGEPLSWDNWTYLGNLTSKLSPSAGFTSPVTGGARVVIDSITATLEGHIVQTVPAGITAGDVIATVPAGLRPIQGIVFFDATVLASTVYTRLPAVINSYGEISLLSTTAIVVESVYFNATYTVLAAS